MQSYQQKQVRFARPFNDWTAEERQEFENTLKALLQEKPVNTELAADLDEVLVEYRNVYIRLGIINADSEEVQPELSAETRERVRTDLVKHQVSHKEVYSEKAANVVREWTTVWNLYVARRRELELSVERGEERLSEMDRQAEKILVGDKKTAKSVESQKRQAQLIVEQLRARLQPFLDLEKDHPELKPPTLAESNSPRRQKRMPRRYWPAKDKNGWRSRARLLGSCEVFESQRSVTWRQFARQRRLSKNLNRGRNSSQTVSSIKILERVH